MGVYSLRLDEPCCYLVLAVTKYSTGRHSLREDSTTRDLDNRKSDRMGKFTYEWGGRGTIYNFPDFLRFLGVWFFPVEDS
jgi:hypothetical protein